MANEWYYAQDGRQMGPVSARELKQFADAGQLRGGDLVWKEGMPDWKPAADVKGLLAGGPAVIVPAPIGTVSPRRRHGRYRSPLGQVLLIFAGVLLIGQMCVPWWSMTLTNTDDYSKFDRPEIRQRNGGEWERIARMSNSEIDAEIASRESVNIDDLIRASSLTVPQTDRKDFELMIRSAMQTQLKFLKIARKDRKWWLEHLKTADKSFGKRLDEKTSELGMSKGSASLRIWGWNEGVSIMGLVFGIVVIVFSTVFISVPILRNWSWTVSIVATVFGILVLIFALIWVFTAPGRDASPEFQQGIVIGPWLFLGGGVMFLLTGIFDMIFGLSHLTRMRRLRAQR